jgi:5-methylcytosine-specific restriction endonuclease McrA
MTGLNIENFKAWLLLQGAEILPKTNEYELLRFRGREVGVVYTSGKTSNRYTLNAITCFLRRTKWDGRPVNTGRQPGYRKEKAKLLDRDGSDCFYCGLPLGDDITLEHLQSLVSGGSNTLANEVLAHEKCNQEAGVLSVAEKVKIAISKRIKLSDRQ